MTDVNLPLKHHYIPRFLLTEWTTDDGKLWRFVREPYAGKVVTKRVAPSEIGYKKGLYATPGVLPEATQQVEQQFMSPLDSAAADAHKILLQGKANSMSQAQRSAWSRFIMSQWFRTPDNLDHLKEAMRHLLTEKDEKLGARYHELRKDGYPETLEEAIANFSPDFAEIAAMKVLRKMSDDPNNGHRLNNMQWSVFEVQGGREFLISDTALQQSRGVFTKYGYFTLPISPHKLFVAVNSIGVAERMTKLSRSDFTARVNRATVRRACEFVGASDLSQEPFIRANFNQEDHSTLIKRLAQKYRDKNK